MLGGVLDRLAAAVIDRRFQLGRVATEPGVRDRDGTGGGAGDLSQRRTESEIGQDLRMYPPGDFAQLVDRLLQVRSDLAELPPKPRIAAGQLARDAEPDTQRYQTLLHPVVDIALKPFALLVDDVQYAYKAADDGTRAVCGSDTVTVVTFRQADI